MGPYGVPGSWDLGLRDLGLWDLGFRDLQPATKLNYWWSQALKVMGFVMLAMMIVRVIMTPRMTLVVGMLMTALLASIG